MYKRQRLNIATGTVEARAPRDVPVTGNRLNVSDGTVTTLGKATVVPTGIQLNQSLGDITVIGKATISLSGDRVNITTEAYGSGSPKPFEVQAKCVVVLGAGPRLNITTEEYGQGTPLPFIVKANAKIGPTNGLNSSRLNIANSPVDFRIWTQVDPDANQNWNNI